MIYPIELRNMILATILVLYFTATIFVNLAKLLVTLK